MQVAVRVAGLEQGVRQARVAALVDRIVADARRRIEAEHAASAGLAAPASASGSKQGG